MNRRIVPLLVAVVGAASFVWPFYVVSYQQTQVIHFTGLELLQGTTFHQALVYGGESALPPPLGMVPAAWLTSSAILAAGVALFRGGRWGYLIARAAALVAIVAAIQMRARGQHAIAAIVPPSLRVDPLPMLWIPLAVAVVLWLLSVLRAKANAPASAGASGK